LPSPSVRNEKTIVAILFFTWGTVFLDRMSQLYLAPYFAPEFRLSDAQVGFLASLVAASWAVSSLVFGAVSDRFGRRAVLVPGVLVFSLLSWVSGVAHSFEQLLVVRALMGVAEGPCWTVINALNEESSDSSRRGRNSGIVVSAAALIGLFVAPILTTQVAAHLGWRWGFFVAGTPGLLMALLIWKFVPEPQRAQQTEADSVQPRGGVFSVLRYSNIWLCCLGAAGFMGWLFLQNVFAPLYITGPAQQSGTTAGFLLGAAGLGSFFIGLILPSLSDRVSRKSVLLISAVLSAILPLALCVPSLYHHLWILAAILFCTQGGQAMAALVIVLMPAESVPPRFIATALGMTTLVGELLGGALAPTLGGAVAEKYGLAAPLWMASACMLLVIVSALLFREKQHSASA
jgi:predicted MFS family arabinose efflux permease